MSASLWTMPMLYMHSSLAKTIYSPNQDSTLCPPTLICGLSTMWTLEGGQDTRTSAFLPSETLPAPWKMSAASALPQGAPRIIYLGLASKLRSLRNSNQAGYPQHYVGWVWDWTQPEPPVVSLSTKLHSHCLALFVPRNLTRKNDIIETSNQLSLKLVTRIV